MSNRVAALDGGTSYHHVALNDPRWAHLIDARIYLPELDNADLSAFDILVATCRSNPDQISQNKENLDAFLARGGMIVAFAGTAPERWLPNITAREARVNYWWWLEDNPDSGLHVANPQHDLFTAMRLDDMTWHHHALFDPPAGATSLVNHVDGGSIFYDDPASTSGRLLITSLDPFFHHGSYFMPATTRFLEKFIPWLKRCSIARAPA